MKPRDILLKWIDAFNRHDADGLAALYNDEAVNFQTPLGPVKGKQAIRDQFNREFAQADMICLVEQILQDGEWAVLEWKDPLGLRGCGFFQVQNGLIVYQRGYWDKLSFLKAHGLPVPGDGSF